MAFCKKCGTQMDDAAQFCPSCGATQNGSAPAVNNEQQDIADNKIMAILAYCGPLVLVPIFAAPKSKFARYHSNQGLLLLIAEVAYGIIQGILTAILGMLFPWSWEYGWIGGHGPVYDIITTILGILWIAWGILAILGIVNAVQGKLKELPIIGKFKLLK